MGRAIDLSHSFSEKFKGFSIESCRTVEVNGWNASTLKFYSHCGTHIDAPIHFNVSNQTIDQIEVSNFIGKAWIVDARTVGEKGLITTNEIDLIIKKKFQPGDSFLIRTDWHKKIHTPEYRDNLPRISEEFANWCVENKVKMLGVEPPSVADVNNVEEVTKIHKILLKNVIIIEGLANLDKLEENKCVELIALPLKIMNGDGAPARVIAIDKY